MGCKLVNFIETTGFIEYQSRCDWKYGKFPSSYNGCGWIAFYNLTRLIFNDKDFVKVASETLNSFEKTVDLKGILGTSVFDMLRHLKEKYNSKYVDCKMRVMRRYRSANIPRFGIIYYFTGHSFHYVMFENNGFNFVFHNVESRVETRSMDKFEKKYIKCPFYIMFELNEV